MGDLKRFPSARDLRTPGLEGKFHSGNGGSRGIKKIFHFWAPICVCMCVYVCVCVCSTADPTALLRALGFSLTHRLGRPHYVWDEYGVLEEVEIRVTVCGSVYVE